MTAGKSLKQQNAWLIRTALVDQAPVTFVPSAILS
jgi:hypothetical protein